MTDESPGYEKRDTRPAGILIAAGIITAATVLAVLVSGLLDRSFRATEPEADPHPLAAEEPALPPGPRLQVRPQSDVESHREAEEEVLGSYAWVDPERGLVRVPIEVGIELALEQGFPVRGPAGEPARGGAGEEEAER